MLGLTGSGFDVYFEIEDFGFTALCTVLNEDLDLGLGLWGKFFRIVLAPRNFPCVNLKRP